MSGTVILIFRKASTWKGELYPNFSRESEQGVFEKKRKKVQKLLGKIERVLNTGS